MEKYTGYDLLLGGLFFALALVLPILFHALSLGSAFLPMFYPIVIAGFLLPPAVSLTVGFLSPIISSTLTGMPPLFPPIAIIMMFEGIILTICPYILYQKYKFNIWLTAFLTMVLDRCFLLISVFAFSYILKLPEKILSLASILYSLPGVIIIIVFIPPVVKKLKNKISQIRIYE